MRAAERRWEKLATQRDKRSCRKGTTTSNAKGQAKLSKSDKNREAKGQAIVSQRNTINDSKTRKQRERESERARERGYC